MPMDSDRFNVAANLLALVVTVVHFLLWSCGWQRRNGWHPPGRKPSAMPPRVARRKKPRKRKRPGR